MTTHFILSLIDQAEFAIISKSINDYENKTILQIFKKNKSKQKPCLSGRDEKLLTHLKIH